MSVDFVCVAPNYPTATNNYGRCPCGRRALPVCVELVYLTATKHATRPHPVSLEMSNVLEIGETLFHKSSSWTNIPNYNLFLETKQYLRIGTSWCR